jgi:hypothetical protein
VDEDEEEGKQGFIQALMIWAGLIIAILLCVFLFIPCKVQIVIQRLRDKHYILGEKK